MMGCGVAPRGSLKLAHLAAKLTPSISGGPHMPVSCPSAFCLLFLHAAAGRQLCMSVCTALLLLPCVVAHLSLEVDVHSSIVASLAVRNLVVESGTAYSTAIKAKHCFAYCAANHHQAFAVSVSKWASITS